MGVLGRTCESYEDFFADDDQPRIWRTTLDEDGAERAVYLVRTPNGLRGELAAAHQVDEHEDGTFSVQPKPGNSNSILVEWPHAERPKRWHGYIDHNVFSAVD